MALPEMDRILGTKKAEASFLAAACTLALLYRGWGLFSTIASVIPSTSHISYDGVYYAQIARNILRGDGLGWEAMVFPVLQPIIVATVSFLTGITNLPVIANYINLVAGVALIIPAYYLTRDIFGRSAAVATILILIPYPHLVAICCGDTAESLYSALVVLSVLAAYRALSSGKGLSMFLAGACLGATYLARPEGLNIFAVFFAVAVWRLWKEKGAARALGMALAGFALLALPYIAFLTDSYGRPVLSSKLPYESVVMKYKVLGEQLKMADVDGLTPSGRLAWMEKGGAGLLLEYFREDPKKFMGSYLANLASELPWKVGNSTHLQGYPIVYPLCFWIPAMLGFWLLLRDRESRWVAFLVYAPFTNLLVYPIFTHGFWIYHVPYAPLLVMLAAGGYQHLSVRLKPLTGVALPLLLAVTVYWIGYSSYTRLTSSPQQLESINIRTKISNESIKAGEDARRVLGTDPTYMMRWSRLVYYLGGRWLNMPAAMPDEVIEHAIKEGAGFIVEEMAGDRVAASSYFEGEPDLRLVYMYKSDIAPYIVLIWKIERGQV